MGFWDNPHIEDTAPFQPKQWFIDLDTVILATDYFDRAGSKRNQEFPPLGAIREENAWMGGGVYKNIFVDGKAKFMWVWNNSGSDIAKGVPMQKRANLTITDLVSGGVNYGVDTGLTANNLIGGLIQCNDNNSGAGAAPEGEVGKIYANDATTIKFQPDMSVALAVSDDMIIFFHHHVTVGATGVQLGDFRGVPVASGGIPNGYMGWSVIEADAAQCLALPAAGGAAITVAKGIINGNGGFFDDGSTSAVPLILGNALHGLQADAVARLFMASLARNLARVVSV
jgi:hypothetical protein